LRALHVSLFCLFLFLALTNVCIAADENEVLSKINEAKNGLGQAFKTVWEAEKALVNISSLVAKLNEAEELLMEAEIAYRNGKLDEAASKADESIAMANDVLDEALDLKGSAIAHAQRVFWMTLTFSSLGIIVFISILFLVWSWFKRLYIRELLKTKPEVASNVEN
jgi:hypothetical protein